MEYRYEFVLGLLNVMVNPVLFFFPFWFIELPLRHSSDCQTYFASYPDTISSVQCSIYIYILQLALDFFFSRVGIFIWLFYTLLRIA